MPKISVIGAGNVGATLAQRLIEKDFADVVMLDVVEGIPQGKALDISQSANVLGFSHIITGSNDYAETAGSEIVVITAGIARKPGMTREELLAINQKIMTDVVSNCLKYSPEATLVVVSNPVDTMTYLAWKLSGLPRKRVVGLSGVLDGGRLATFVARELGVKPSAVTPCVMGEHGGSMVVMPRFTLVNGKPLSELVSAEKADELAKRAVNGGAEIVAFLKTGSAFYAPSASIAAMVEAIFTGSGKVMNCAAVLDGEYGLKNIVLGVPVKLGKGGIQEIITLPLDGAENARLLASAEVVKGQIAALSL